MRQLKYHEKKLLRKVSLYQWKGDDNIRVAKILRRYHIQNREDYVAYTHICGMVTKLANKLKVVHRCKILVVILLDVYQLRFLTPHSTMLNRHSNQTIPFA